MRANAYMLARELGIPLTVALKEPYGEVARFFSFLGGIKEGEEARRNA